MSSLTHTVQPSHIKSSQHASQLQSLGDSSARLQAELTAARRQLAELRAHAESLQALDLSRCIELENELRESLEKIEKRKVRPVLR